MSRYDPFWPGLRWQPPSVQSRPRRSPFEEVRERAEPVPPRVALPVDEPETMIPEPPSPPPDETETLRAAARELEATRTRIERDAQRTEQDLKAKLVGELLPVMDNLDRTLRAADETSDLALVEGVRMIRSQLEQVLSRYGVERIDALGERFDPGLHEAITIRLGAAKDAGRVVDQAAAGYRLGGKVLRASKVVVGALRD